MMKSPRKSSFAVQKCIHLFQNTLSTQHGNGKNFDLHITQFDWLPPPRHSPLPPSPFAVASLPLQLPAPAIASMARTQLPCSTACLMGKPSTWGRERRGGSRD